jgi:hypothetical protein
VAHRASGSTVDLRITSKTNSTRHAQSHGCHILLQVGVSFCVANNNSHAALPFKTVDHNEDISIRDAPQLLSGYRPGKGVCSTKRRAGNSSFRKRMEIEILIY